MRVQKVFKKPSLTKQSFKKECDINVLLSRYHTNSNVDYLQQFQGYVAPRFGDASEVPSLQESYEKVYAAQTAFASMPAEIRRRFANDPMLLAEFISDEKNRDEAEKLGLLKKPIVQKVDDPVKQG